MYEEKFLNFYDFLKILANSDMSENIKPRLQMNFTELMFFYVQRKFIRQEIWYKVLEQFNITEERTEFRTIQHFSRSTWGWYHVVSALTSYILNLTSYILHITSYLYILQDITCIWRFAYVFPLLVSLLTPGKRRFIPHVYLCGYTFYWLRHGYVASSLPPPS